LLDKTQFTVNIWDSGMPEVFLIHVQTAVNACKRKGLFSDYNAASNDVCAANEAVVTYQEVIAKAKPGKAKKAEETNPPATAEESLKDASAKLAVARADQKTAAEGFFLQYANLLTEDARYHWEKIVTSQSYTYPWTDLQKKEHG
jgi:hypothetical protein